MKRTGLIVGLLIGMLALIVVTAAGVAEAQPAAQADDESCLSCHTNQEVLVALAVTEEGGEELSEGEG
ncbi:MAG: hypothetical protein JXD18_05795 [Anaerolineae bacterium]|nr:hypothetical protein [Anaerolineae bacterium]